jgi:vacuolar iron transporter family protein
LYHKKIFVYQWFCKSLYIALDIVQFLGPPSKAAPKIVQGRVTLRKKRCFMVEPSSPKDHFHGQTALKHLAEVRGDSVSASLEVHGAETPGPFFAFLDSARETALLVAFGLIGVDFFNVASRHKFIVAVAILSGWVFWKGARSTILAWSRLYRMHKVATEEQTEIQTNRPQEREELIALYGAKGFSGPLLDTVVDVLMADQDRLLTVMLQEEMGLRLEENPHPLLQGIGAAAGALASFLVLWPAVVWLPELWAVACCVVVVALLGGFFARKEKNAVLPAFVWNGMIAGVGCVLVRTFMEIFVQ